MSLNIRYNTLREFVLLKIHRYFTFLLIDFRISQNEDDWLSHRSRVDIILMTKCYLGGQK